MQSLKKIFSIAFKTIIDFIVFKFENDISVEDHLNLSKKFNDELNKHKKKNPALLNYWFSELSTETVVNSSIFNINPFHVTQLEELSEDKLNIISNKLILDANLEDFLYSKQIIFGSSFVLMILIIYLKDNSNEALGDNVRDIAERVLRQMEVKRESLLTFKNAPSDIYSSLSEQIRLITVLLELYSLFNDIRYINAALKAHDRIFNSLKKIKLSRDEKDKEMKKTLLFYYYIKSIKTQESKMLEIVQ